MDGVNDLGGRGDRAQKLVRGGKATRRVEPSTSSANWKPGSSPVPKSGWAQRVSALTSENAEYKDGGSSLESTTEELLPNSGRATCAKDWYNTGKDGPSTTRSALDPVRSATAMRAAV